MHGVRVRVVRMRPPASRMFSGTARTGALKSVCAPPVRRRGVSGSCLPFWLSADVSTRDGWSCILREVRMRLVMLLLFVSHSSLELKRRKIFTNTLKITNQIQNHLARTDLLCTTVAWLAVYDSAQW